MVFERNPCPVCKAQPVLSRMSNGDYAVTCWGSDGHIVGARATTADRARVDWDKLTAPVTADLQTAGESDRPDPADIGAGTTFGTARGRCDLPTQPVTADLSAWKGVDHAS